MNVILAPILFIALFFVILLIVQLAKPWMSRHISLKKNILFAGIYLAILVIAVPIYYGLPTQVFIQASGSKNPVIMKSPAEMQKEFGWGEPSKGRVDPFEKGEAYQSSSQTFKLDTNVLTFKESNSRNYSVYVQRKSVDDGEMDVSTYNKGDYIADIDFTRAVLPPSISIEKGTLSISAPAKQNFEFKQFVADFILKQFNRPYPNLQTGFSSMHTPTIILIKVPKSLDIQDNSNTVQFVN